MKDEQQITALREEIRRVGNISRLPHVYRATAATVSPAGGTMATRPARSPPAGRRSTLGVG